MSPLPWQMSYAASADLENSELQTDVMRFMAILAFCLVAIFAIVQSIPLQPAQSQAPPPAETDVVVELPAVVAPVSPAVESKEPEPVAAVPVVPQPTPQVVPAAPEPRQKPNPVSKPVAKPLPVPRYTPKPQPARTEPPRQTDPEPTPQPTPVRQGLSLRFESDAILRSLVERRLVSLYAIAGDDFYRMAVSAGRVSFGAGAAPAQFHEMVLETVPADVLSSFELQHGVAARQLTWGVTLPAATTSQLRRFVRTNYQGSLVITSEAGLALAGSG